MAHQLGGFAILGLSTKSVYPVDQGHNSRTGEQYVVYFGTGQRDRASHKQYMGAIGPSCGIIEFKADGEMNKTFKRTEIPLIFESWNQRSGSIVGGMLTVRE